MHSIIVLECANRGNEGCDEVTQPAQAAFIVEGALILAAHLGDQCTQLVTWAHRTLDIQTGKPFNVFKRYPRG